MNLAKKTGRQSDSEATGGDAQPEPTGVEAQVLGFAEDLGRMLGTAEKKANEWLNQRQDAVKTLTRLRDTANQLLERLQAGASGAVARKRGRPAKAASTASEPAVKRKRNFKMSAAQKKAVGDRMRKYWAARRKAEAK